MFWSQATISTRTRWTSFRVKLIYYNYKHLFKSNVIQSVCLSPMFVTKQEFPLVKTTICILWAVNVAASKSGIIIKRQNQVSKSSVKIFNKAFCPVPPPPLRHSLFHSFVILIWRVRKEAFFKRFCFVTSKRQALVKIYSSSKSLNLNEF